MTRRSFLGVTTAVATTGLDVTGQYNQEHQTADNGLDLDELDFWMMYRGKYPGDSSDRNMYSTGFQYYGPEDDHSEIEHWTVYGADELSGQIQLEARFEKEQPLYFKEDTPFETGEGTQTPVLPETVEETEFVLSELHTETGDNIYGIFERDTYLSDLQRIIKDPYIAEYPEKITAECPEDALRTCLKAKEIL